MPICGPCSISSRDCLYSGETQQSQQSQKSKSSPAVSLASKRGTSIPQTIPEAPLQLVPQAQAYPSPRNLYPSPVEAQQPAPSPVPLAEAYQYAYSPDTVASELLTTDMASNRWLDLLATDAAQADAGFSLAPTPTPEDSVSNTGHEVRAIGTENQPISGSVTIPAPPANAASERHAWSLDRDIVLTNQECVLFRTFAERASLWVSGRNSVFANLPITDRRRAQLDLFDPFKLFSTYATRLAVSVSPHSR